MQQNNAEHPLTALKSGGSQGASGESTTTNHEPFVNMAIDNDFRHTANTVYLPE